MATQDSPQRLQQIDTARFPKEYPVRKMISEQDEDWIVEAITKRLAMLANRLEEEAGNSPSLDFQSVALTHEAKGIRRAALLVSSGEWKKP